MSKLVNVRPLAAALLGVVSLAILVACGSGGDPGGPASVAVAAQAPGEATSSPEGDSPIVARSTSDSAGETPVQLASGLAEPTHGADSGEAATVSASLPGDQGETGIAEPSASPPITDGLKTDNAPATASVSPIDDEPEASAAANEPEAESKPALMTAYDIFGFRLDLDQGAEVRAAGGSVNAQGAINFSLGEVNSVLTWVPQTGTDPLSLVSGTYGIIKSSQEGVVFDTITDGEITVSGQSGIFLGFKSTQESGSQLGGGLIGSWACAEADTAYTLTLTGTDAPILQIRFDRMLENFTCEA